MCGICGQYNFADGGTPVERRNLQAMARSIAHRGPDDEGYYVDGPLGLGFRRLSIIDLAGGHQPMLDESESVCVIFNGEIYNFKELRRELEGFGHAFRTRCDTEVIVHGYKQWGDDVLNHLNGMFGLAIWDVRKRRLILARDPFGIKLVYYTIKNGQLYFGSEIRPVLAGTGEQPDLDPSSLNLFLRYRFTPSPHTIFRGIQKLEAGTMLICEKGTATVRRWYCYQPESFSPPKSEKQAEEELLALYKQSIERHLISDVPVGLLLSGGIDSGLLLALMGLYGESWRTYTAGYGASYSDDELIDAAATASQFSSRHTPVILDRTKFEEALQGIVAHLEEPIAASSIVPMYFVCQRAREDVKVALVGQGPDELFGGYRRHLGVRYRGYWEKLPAWMRTSIASAITALPRNETLKRGIHSFDVGDQVQFYEHVLSLLPGSEVDGLFQDGLLDQNTHRDLRECWSTLVPLIGKTDVLGGFQFLETRSTLPDELLMYADKLSMAHGLEVRVPYLDKELVEYVERLPANFKIRNGSQKWLHRKVCQQFLPKSTLRRKKRGFGVNVVDDWFRSALNSKMEDIFMDKSSLMYQYLRPAAVEQMFNLHKAGRSDYHKILFSLIVFEQWLRVHIPLHKVNRREVGSIC